MVSASVQVLPFGLTLKDFTEHFSTAMLLVVLACLWRIMSLHRQERREWMERVENIHREHRDRWDRREMELNETRKVVLDGLLAQVQANNRITSALLLRGKAARSDA